MQKRGFIIIIIIALALILGWRYYQAKKETGAEHTPPNPLSISKNSDSFSIRLSIPLQSYYLMKDGFVNSDTASINLHAAAFVKNIEELSLDELKADSNIVNLARMLKTNIGTAALQVLAANDIEAKRKSFQSVSDAFFDLLRSVQYRGSKVYQDFCPMAFDNAGASWLSNDSTIMNPYFGSKMLHCGEVKDSISFQ